MKRLLLILCTFAALSVYAQQTFYGNVGEYITLPEPTPPSSAYMVFDMVYSTDSEHLYVVPGTSRVKIVSYFSYKEIVKCEYRMVRQYYVAGQVYEDWQTGYAYYYIECLGSDPDPDPDPDPDEDIYSHLVTIEGHEVWYCSTKLYDVPAIIICRPPFISSSLACIDQSITGRVTIPEVNRDGIPVRRINCGAFYNVNGMTELVLPKSLQSIDLYAAQKCGALKSITCLSETPPQSLYSNGQIFDYDIFNNATLYVPKGCKSSYSSATGWSGFKTIKEIGEEQQAKLALFASPSGGQVSKGTTVTLTAKADGSTVSGCDIYYTLNGNTPSKSSTKYTSSGITINSDCMLKAIAYKDGYETSDVGEWKYTIKNDIIDPTSIDVYPSSKTIKVGDTFTATYSLTPSNATTTVTWYSDNSTIASVSSSGLVTGKSAGSTYINAKTANGKEDWCKVTVEPTSKPKLVLSASPSGGQVSEGTKVTLTAKANGSTVSGCDIYYTFNGNTPTKSSTKYTSSGISINSDCTLKAIAYKDGYEKSDVLTEYYTIDSTLPVIKQVSAGDSHTMILKTDGSLWACGENAGRYGDGTTTDSKTPTKVMDGGVVAVSAGSYHTMILKTDGSLWACGNNYYGQLGDGTTTNRKTQTKVMDSGVAAVSAGYYHTMILKTEGSLWACGSNSCGRFGDGTTTDSKTPTKVMDGGVAAVSAGYSHTMILKIDGSLWACGMNYEGQLGDGTTTERKIPTKVMDGGVVAVSAGSYHTMILKTDGSLWACGYNNCGQLGDGTTTNRKTPTKVMDGGVAAVSAGYSYTMILKTDGSLWACGSNSKTPTKVMDGGVAAVSAGGGHTMILKTDGSLWAYGRNDYGQLGDGTTIDRSYPVLIVESKNNTKLSLAASPSGGQVIKGSTVILTAKADGSTISGCDIYYTLNGSTPTKNSTKYSSSGITISSDCTLKAIAYKDGYETSDVLTEVYTIKYDDIRLNVASSGYATFFSSESAYKMPSELSAKVVKAADNGKLTYETIIIIDGSNGNIVPRGLPVMIESDTKQTGTYTLTAVESGTTYTGTNLLRGSDEATTTTGEGYHYKLSYGPTGTKWDDVFGWYWGAQNGAPFQIDEHKAWLVVPRSGTRAAGFTIEGESLDIETIDQTPLTTDYYYDLQGRRVTDVKTSKGIYFRNGRKVVVK